jgi:hypothetical protein
MIEFIWSGNGGSDEKHVRDFNDVDFIDVSSINELDEGWWFVGLFEADDESHALSDDGGEIAFENLNEEGVFCGFVQIVDFLVVTFEEFETFLVVGFVEEVSDLFLGIEVFDLIVDGIVGNFIVFLKGEVKEFEGVEEEDLVMVEDVVRG